MKELAVEKRRRPRGRPLTGLMLGAMIGAAAVYLLDPDRGRSRRARLQDQLGALGRRQSRLLEGAKKQADTQIAGAMRAAATRANRPIGDDATIAHRIESQVFRDPDIPKGAINVNVESGKAVLRGTLRDQDQVLAVMQRVRDVQGVDQVENLLQVESKSSPQL